MTHRDFEKRAETLSIIKEKIEESILFGMEEKTALMTLAENSEKYILNMHEMIEDIMDDYSNLVNEDFMDDDCGFDAAPDKVAEMEDLIVEECFRCYKAGILDAIYGAAKQRLVSETPGSLVGAMKALEHE